MDIMSDVELSEWLDDPEHKFLVLAESWRCYLEWCAKYKLNPRDEQIQYVTDSYYMRGWSPEQTVIVAVCNWNWAHWQNNESPATKKNNAQILYTLDHYQALGTRIITDECR